MKILIVHTYENTLETEVSDDLTPEQQKEEAKKLAAEMDQSDASWICAGFFKLGEDETSYDEEWFDLP
jgi:hypothetical protein